MIRDILTRAAADGCVEPRTLAADLGVSHALVETMLDDLVKRGYLAVMASDTPAAAGCGGCAAKRACAGRAPRLWRLTEKGRAAV